MGKGQKLCFAHNSDFQKGLHREFFAIVLDVGTSRGIGSFRSEFDGHIGRRSNTSEKNAFSTGPGI